MRLGDRGIDVEDLQDFLIKEGFLSEREECFGPKTKVAVVQLQERLGYRPTGVWSEDLKLLYELERG